VRDQWLADIERVRTGAYFDGIEGFQAYLDPAQPTLLNHLPPDALILSMDSRRTLAQAEQREQELQELVAVEIDRGELPQGLRPGLVAIKSLRDTVQGWRRLEIARGADLGTIDLGFEAVDAYAGRIDAFSDRVRTDARAKSRVLIVTQQEPRLRELLEDRDVYPAGGVFLWSQTPLSPGLVVLGNQPLAQGFRIPSQQLEVYGDSDLFGGLRQRVRRGVVRARSATWDLEFEPGDLIVHVDHGIGRFTGMRVMGDDGQEREYMQLEYAEGDKLFVPVEHLDRVQKYVGGGDAAPRLQRLGSGDWIGPSARYASPSRRSRTTCSTSTRSGSWSRAMLFRRTVPGSKSSSSPSLTTRRRTRSASCRRSRPTWRTRVRWTGCCAATSALARQS